MSIGADHVPIVAIKLGATGAVALSGATSARAGAIAVEAEEPTAAGDCFDAGFLYARLRGDSLQNCLRLGNVCGGLATRAPGNAAAPTLEEAERWLKPCEDS